VPSTKQILSSFHEKFNAICSSRHLQPASTSRNATATTTSHREQILHIDPAVRNLASYRTAHVCARHACQVQVLPGSAGAQRQLQSQKASERIQLTNTRRCRAVRTGAALFSYIPCPSVLSSSLALLYDLRRGRPRRKSRKQVHFCFFLKGSPKQSLFGWSENRAPLFMEVEKMGESRDLESSGGEQRSFTRCVRCPLVSLVLSSCLYQGPPLLTRLPASFSLCCRFRLLLSAAGCVVLNMYEVCISCIFIDKNYIL